MWLKLIRNFNLFRESLAFLLFYGLFDLDLMLIKFKHKYKCLYFKMRWQVFYTLDL